MLQAIKKIIIMTIVNIIFFYSFQSTADEMVLIKKYGFGLERDIKGRPLIYPHNFLLKFWFLFSYVITYLKS